MYKGVMVVITILSDKIVCFASARVEYDISSLPTPCSICILPALISSANGAIKRV